MPSQGSNIVLRNEINDRHIQSAITCLCSDASGSYLFAADTSGSIVPLNVKTFNNIKSSSSLKQDKT
jgi:hypothetical protein